MTQKRQLSEHVLPHDQLPDMTAPQAQSAMTQHPQESWAVEVAGRSAFNVWAKRGDRWEVVEITQERARLIADAPDTAAERDRLRAERDVALIALSNLVHRYKFDGIPGDSLPFVTAAQDVIDSMEAGAGAAHLQSEADRLRAIVAEMVELLATGASIVPFGSNGRLEWMMSAASVIDRATGA